jgi:SPP1 gp7 family putative phage head morphogenesis protein
MVKTTNEEILDAVIRHQIYLQRYSGMVRNKITKLLNASEHELARRIRDQLRNSAGLGTSIEWRRLQSLLAALDAIRLKSWEGARKLLLDEMEQLAYQEPIILSGLYTTPIPVQVSTVLPSNGFLRAVALSRPFEGRLLKEWADNMQAEDIRRIHSAVQAGMIAGEDHATIAQRVVGRARLLGADGVTEVTRRQVQTIVRTAVQHVANGARDAFFDSNKTLFKLEQFVATLDSRTTPICRSLDGKKYKIGKGPRPPLHFQCRSLRVAAVDGTLLGDRPAKPTTERLLVQEYAKRNGLGDIKSRDALPRGTKGDYDQWARGRIRQIVGPVPASETYQTWLMGQSVAFQEEVLGEKKARLFRVGGLKLDKFVDYNSQREFTLRELAGKHADAFRAAGLDPDGFR